MNKKKVTYALTKNDTILMTDVGVAAIYYKRKDAVGQKKRIENDNKDVKLKIKRVAIIEV